MVVCLLVMVMVMGLARAASAGGVGAVAGRVTDETGGVLPSVVVDLDAGEYALTAVTGPSGEYRIDGVAPGPAALTFRLVNFSIARPGRWRFRPGRRWRSTSR